VCHCVVEWSKIRPYQSYLSTDAFNQYREA
jgi:hypothetical protein